MYMKMWGMPENIFQVDRSRSHFLNDKIDYFNKGVEMLVLHLNSPAKRVWKPTIN